MSRSLSLAFLAAAACVPEPAALAPATLLAPPSLVLDAPDVVLPGDVATITVSGAGNSEPVYLTYSVGSGRPPCIRPAGGLCLDIPAPASLLARVNADASGTATFNVNVPHAARIGLEVQLQAVIVRGVGGFASAKSNADAITVVEGTFGCTNPDALNFDPLANLDDGSCSVVPATTPEYVGPAGPDLSDGGWVLCSGTASGSTDYLGFYGPCDGASEVRFACSADADATAEFTSGTVPGADFLDTTCDAWDGGANSVYAGGRILSLDDSDPVCGSFNVAFDMYMDMVSPQWGCAGSFNTHTTGGRMWMYGRSDLADFGCTDPAAGNYDPTAEVDDGSCEAVDPRFVPSFAGEVGPDLSGSGFRQCAGTASASTTSSEFYALCSGYDEIVFACSANADETAEYQSPVLPLGGASLTDGTCDAWSSGASSAYFGGHILSLDTDTPPVCDSFNVAFDLYMDMVSPQWGCAGTVNTHTTGGRMWAWVR